jgi:hypothetical protein
MSFTCLKILIVYKLLKLILYSEKLLTPDCVESEAIPYELLVITVMIDVGEVLRSWGFDFILTGYHRADIACQQR